LKNAAGAKGGLFKTRENNKKIKILKTKKIKKATKIKINKKIKSNK